tara:strand:- start:11643 stop:14255 length:2613 start_codon:yes stop_codon:yes gene_type:complete
MKSQALIAMGVLTTTSLISQGGVDFSWANAQDGEWSSGLSWDSGIVPTSWAGVQLGLGGAYTVSLKGDQSAAALQIANPQAVLAIRPGGILNMYGDLENNGLIMQFSGFAPAGSGIDVQSDMTLSGMGTLRMHTTGPNSRINTLRNSTITHGQGHSIVGQGQINASMVNNGSIRADVKGEQMRLAGFDKVNNGLIKAIGGGVMELNEIKVSQGAGGQIMADGIGAQVELVDATVRGGSLLSSDGAVIELSGVSTIDGGRFDGRIHVLGGSTMRLENSWTNDGTVVVNSDRQWATTSIDVVNSLSLDGSGSIQLSYAVDRASVNSLDGAVLTQGPEHTIRGRGQLSAAFVNNGLVSANVSGAPLRLNGENKTNNAVLEAVQSSTLELYDMTISQGESGKILADGLGSAVKLVNASVVGGDLISSNGGIIEYRRYGSFTGVTTIGQINIIGHGRLSIFDSWTNNGTVTLSSQIGLNGEISFANSLVIDGHGTMIMDSPYGGALLTSAIGQVVTNGKDHSIVGQGLIFAELINDGLIRANVPGKDIWFFRYDKTNNATIEAVNAGALVFEEATVTQGPDGIIKAHGLGSEIKLWDSKIVGGQIQSGQGAGVFVLVDSELEAVDFSGSMNIPDGNTLAIKNGVLNNGTIVVNSSDGQELSALQWDEHTTLFGAGTVQLHSPASVLRAGEEVAGGGLGPDQRLEGVGEIRLPLTNNGTLAPGLGLGTMLASEPVEFTNTAVFEVEVNAVAGDVLESTSTIDLGGTLDVRFVEDFASVGYWARSAMRATDIAGRFDTVLIPDAPDGFVTRVFNTGTELVIGQTLAADLTLDGVLDFFDISAFLDAYGSAEINADWNSDGAIDAFDVMGFLDDFNGH